ncbi:MAG: fimbrial protein FimV [Nitrosomonas sp.]|nr:fimbrial protein FimV [Nitrosomonas sp.]
MYKTSFKVSLFLIILLLPYTVLFAAGLGKLSLTSALGQPLSAEIDIVTTNKDEIPSLKASIASRDAFAQAGINYETFFSAIKVSIESRTNGNPYIKLSSPQAVNDPFLNLLVELNWASGRILREYAVLLDPAESAPKQIAAPSIPATVAPVVAAPQKDTPPALDSSPSKKTVPVKNPKPAKTTTENTALQTTGTYGPVAPGDNLSAIARQVLPAGVDLNQMLVALYRANRDAFIAGNMNLLKVGAVLKIPEKGEADAIDKKSARSEIRMQVIDWHNYRSRLASSSRGLSSQKPIRQSDQGKITTRIDKQMINASEAPKEVLRLSSAVQTTTDGEEKVSAGQSGASDRLRMMEEDAIAKNLALKEANERVAMLEKSVENLKKLLELKDASLAQAQAKAESNDKSVTKSEAKPEAVVAPTPQAPIPVPVQLPVSAEKNATELEAEQSASVATTPDVVAPAEAPVPAPAPAPVLPVAAPVENVEASLTDQIFANIEYVGAFLMVILLSALLWVRKRRQRLEEDDDDDDKAAEDFSSRIKSRMAGMAGAHQAVAAADSYASDDEDSMHPNTAAAAHSVQEEDRDFEQNTVMYANFSEKSEETEFDDHPQSDLDDDATKHHFQSAEASNDIDLADEDTDHNTSAHANYETEFDLADAKEANQNDSVAINLSDYDSAPSSATEEVSSDFAMASEAASDQEHTIDFDLSPEAIKLADEDIQKINPASNGKASATARDLSPLELMDELDSSDQLASDDIDGSAKAIPVVPELGLENINLDIENADSAAQQENESDLNANSEQWQEVETKLDLAKAYQEMDDKEGAKEMLEEVIRDGDTKQKRAAKKLMKSL